MLISQAIKISIQKLNNAGINSSYIDSIILMQYALNLESKEQVIFATPERNLSQTESEKFFSFIKRRQSREPVSYIINKREFYGYDFYINKNTLDPRPDSETIIELFKEIVDRNKNYEILDIGTGSGCLAITILLEFPNIIGTAIDISQDAIEVCKINIDKFKLNNRLRAKKFDILNCENFIFNISSEKFDIIISNPPYISTCDINKLQDEIRNYEPRIALDGGIDGLDFYKKIAESAEMLLKKNGLIFLEIGDNQDLDIERIFIKNKLKLISKKKDLSQRYRAMSFEFIG